MTFSQHSPSPGDFEALGFEALGLDQALLMALNAIGHHRPSATQVQTIPPLLQGRDVLIEAHTGSGKTAAFVLPLLQHLVQYKKTYANPVEAGGNFVSDTGANAGTNVRTDGPQALIMEPTRELAAQAAAVCRQMGRHLPFRTRVICGGVPREQQLKGLAGGVDIVVATHGRLLDLVTQGNLSLDNLRYLVLDEADRLLDDEFTAAMTTLSTHFPDIPPQTVFCSATLPPPVMALARKVTRDPVRIQVETGLATTQHIRQRALFVSHEAKAATMLRLLGHYTGRIIVFVQTKQGAESLARTHAKQGVDVETLHGDKTQGARNRALTRFRAGHVRILVTTDIAARGLDVADVNYVINADMPNTVETYIHRIGRTARAGRRGTALSLIDPQERHVLRDIEQTLGQRIRIITEADPDR